MSQRTENGSQTLTSLAQLGEVFGLPPVDPVVDPAYDGDLSSLRALSVLDQLATSDRTYKARGPFAKEMAVSSTHAVLAMDPHEREAQGIHIVTYLPVDEDGQPTIPDLSNYRLFTLFPDQSRIRFITSSRLALQSAFASEYQVYSPEIVAEIDELVGAQAELRPETVVDRHNRLMQQIKMIDMLIKQEKRRAAAVCDSAVSNGGAFHLGRADEPDIDPLNHIKHQNVYDFLRSSVSIERIFPYVAPLYALTPSDDGLHMRLTMQQPMEINPMRRLLDPQVQPILSKSTHRLATNLNTAFLRDEREQFLAGSDTPQDRLAHNLLAFLFP